MKAKLRAQIKRRDHNTCRYCGVSGDIAKLTIDHIIPVSRGGHPEKKQNLITACFPCNQVKANKTPEEAGMVILTEGYEYTPQGKLRDELSEMEQSIVVNHGRKKRRKAKRRERKTLVKAILRDGIEQHRCPCGTGGYHTVHYHEHHMKKDAA